MSTAIYAVLHFLVDFSCAHAMFRWAGTNMLGAEGVLIYNFCAFALQMPMGTALDCFASRWKRSGELCAAVGVVLTILGCFVGPALLGLGNAAFHVGGGIGVIREDEAKGRKGRALGVFVAPGALGLFLGGQLSEILDVTFLLAIAMLLLTVPLFRLPAYGATEALIGKMRGFFPELCCFLVVILRSYVGLAVVFPWKTGFFMGLLAVFAVVLGKIAGGFAAARFGARNTVAVSLILSAGCYGLASSPLLGIWALFFFNMSMPITLYRLWRRHPELPGFSFGLLTFGLFLGFLPVCLGWRISVGGVLGSLLSLALLLPVVWRAEK